MKIAFGADHAGRALKDHLAGLARDRGDEVVDLGTHDDASVDYPDYGAAVGRAVSSGEADRGVLVCGTGIGISIAANKVPGVRAAVVHDTFTAHYSRAHNDANVLCLGARVIGEGVAEAALEAFLTTDFEAGRHARRVAKLEEGG
jgi:ribose 5-phosphate isomerase B